MQVMQEHCDELKINYSRSADAGTLWQAKNEQFPMQVMQEHCDELKMNNSQCRWCKNTVTSWKWTIPNAGDAGTLWRAEN